MAKTDEEYTAILNRRDSDVEFQWRNFHLRFFSMDTKIILLGLLMVAILGMVGYQWGQDRETDKDSRTAYLEPHKVTQAWLQVVIANQRAIIESVREMRNSTQDAIGEATYMLSIDQKKREELKMEMPQSLRKKLNER